MILELDLFEEIRSYIAILSLIIAVNKKSLIYCSIVELKYIFSFRWQSYIVGERVNKMCTVNYCMCFPKV
jgi:hypothetical protein